MYFDLDKGDKIKCITKAETRLKEKLDECVWAIKKVYESSRNRNRRESFEKFKKMIEDESSLCLLFIHSSLPSFNDLSAKNIYYEYLILVENGKHKSYSSRLYTHDSQENRLHALEEIYNTLNIKIEKKYTNYEQRLLRALYIRYDHFRIALIEKLFRRLSLRYNIPGNLGIFSYTDDSKIEYSRLELKIILDDNPLSYYSEMYHKDMLSYDKVKTNDSSRLFLYEKSKLLVNCIRDIVKLKK